MDVYQTQIWRKEMKTAFGYLLGLLGGYAIGDLAAHSTSPHALIIAIVGIILINLSGHINRAS